MKKGIKILIALLVVAIIAGAAIILSKGGLFLTNKQKFYKNFENEKALTNIMTKYSDLSKNNYDNFESNANMEINSEIDGEELNFKVGMDSIKNGDSFYSNVDVKYDGSNDIKFKVLKEDDKLGILLPGNGKYIVLENKDLRKFAQKLGLTDEELLKAIPNKISGIYPKELLNIDKNIMKKVENIVTNAIDKNIPEENYIKNDKKEITVNGNQIVADEYVLTINEKEAENVLREIFENVKNDDEVINTIVSKIDYIMYADEVDLCSAFIRIGLISYNMTSNSSLNNKITAQDIKDGIDEILAKESEEDEKIDTLKISTYVTKQGIVKILVELDSETKTLFTVDKTEVAKNQYKVLVKTENYENDKLIYGQEVVVNYEVNDDEYKMTEIMKDLVANEELVTIEANFKKNKDGMDIKYNMKSNYDGANMEMKFDENIKNVTTEIPEKLENNETVINNLDMNQLENLLQTVVMQVMLELQKQY